MKRAAEQQDTNLRALNEQIAGLKAEVVKLQAEREKQAEVAAEHARSTAKGRPYEEAVYDAVDALARARGDDCDAVGDLPGSGGRKGDVVVGVDGCRGPAARGSCSRRRTRTRRRTRRSPSSTTRWRSATPTTRSGSCRRRSSCPATARSCARSTATSCSSSSTPRTAAGSALEVAYSLARARTIMAKAAGEGLDAGALRAEVERALAAMDDVRRIKSQLTTATGGIEAARRILDDMAERVRGTSCRSIGSSSPGRATTRRRRAGWSDSAVRSDGDGTAH